GRSTMVRMPTSAGKTRIAEMAIVHHLISAPQERCLYVAPFKALAGEIEGAMAGLFSDLGFRLSTTLGSFETDEAEQEILSTAEVIISTPEKVDLLLRFNREFFDSVGLIVIDEGQVIEDDTRGAHFEILLSRIRTGWPQIRFISLSAVIPESTLEDFSAWLGSDSSSVSQSDWRPAIQRHARFYWRRDRGFVQFLPDPEVPGLEGFLPSVTEVRRFPFVNPATGRVNNPKFPDSTVKAQTAAELAYTLAPSGTVLVFCPTPGYADSVSEAIMRRIQLVEQSDQAVFHEFRDRSTRSSMICADWLGDDHRLTVKLRRGVAVHHGDVPDVIKKAIERDFRERRFQVIVATSTLAQGVNLPIKTVIIHSTHRHIDEENVPLSAREYWNIAGRAGRAGVETEGMILHLCQNDNDVRALRSYARRKNDLEPLESALFRDLLRLVTQRINDPDELQYLDADLLAILVEEDVTEVTDEWVEKVFGSTLAALERLPEVVPIGHTWVMKRPHASDDVRGRALAAVDEGRPVADIAAFFQNDPSTIRRWIRRRRATGSGLSRPRSGRPRRIPPDQEPALKAQAAAHPDATLAVHCAQWQADHGVAVGRSTMRRRLLALDLTLKKRP
ncbi:MAG: DEAD/DEAH box helicase, partial [Chloroflexota bacterium]|nr:DEAD/DEAH box helicase [Chloroflexota bacterium]